MPSTLGEALSALAGDKPDATAIWYDEQRLSYAALEEQVRRCAAGLRELGIEPGDRVALWLPNVPAWIVCFFALARIGALALATNTRFRSAELRSILLRGEVKAVLYWPGYRGIDFAGVLREVAPQLPGLAHVIAYGEGDSDAEPMAQLRVQPPLPVTRFRDIESAKADGAELGTAQLPCLLYTTSGTTSDPKLVVHAQGRIVEFAREVAAAVGYDRPGACSLQAVPFCGTYGFIQAMAALMGGAPMVLMHTFNAQEAASLIRDKGVTLSGMTDEMVRAVYAVERETRPFPGLRLLVRQ